MFTFMVQAIDFFTLGYVQLYFTFFFLTWSVYLFKFFRSRGFRSPTTKPNDYGVSVIVPVVDEDPKIWSRVLKSLQESCKGIKHQIIVVSNGSMGKANGEYARAKGLEVIYLAEADKRAAVAAGAERARHEISIILDSDTQASPDSIRILKDTFTSADIGGVTPLQKIANREPFVRRVSDWLEDLRFNISVRGQSIGGAVFCLPGRLFALRTKLLKAAIPYFLNEFFFGVRCINGDDRTITSWLLENGYKTIYQPASVVYTEAPNTVGQFAAQRLRWARGSLRGTVKASKWLLRYPYTAFTVYSDILLRWLFLAVVIQAILVWTDVLPRHHYIWEVFPDYYTPAGVLFGIVSGYFVGGLLRQLYHLVRFPQDLPFLPGFLVMTTFVLSPVNWYGDITCWRNEWMTRRQE